MAGNDLPSPYDPQDKQSFSYVTVTKRWPVIITNVIDCVHRTNHDLTMSSRDSVNGDIINRRIAEGKVIIEKASGLKYEMARDKPLLPVPDDGGSHVDLYNDELQKLASSGKGTWFTCPWLYAECYLYRLIRSWFALTEHWTQFDPFFLLKEETFKGSGAAVYQLAMTMAEIDSEAERSSLDNDLTRLEILFDEMIQMCFWGNATDLSLLTTLSSGDIEKLQSVGKDAQAASRKYILRNDIDTAWSYLKSLRGGRLDIVLDNAGFEYVTDLILADFLISHTPFIDSAVFQLSRHLVMLIASILIALSSPKQIPWFVSDVTPPDARALLAAISSIPATIPEQDDSNATFYFTARPPSDSHLSALHKLHHRWLKYFEDGKFRLNGCPGLAGGLSGGPGANSDPQELAQRQSGVEFWTRPYSYRELADYPRMAGLEGSSLVIFKGDLNYRKLTGDLRWAPSTPFDVVIGPLSGKVPILSLRTNKADVIVGLPEGLGEQMDSDPATEGWRTSGRYVNHIPIALQT
ncbi:hypothetical protein FRB99_002973 [Tulasnella sp. 403]|nr:hypothetical protein FRB99_002973 [Tulasnella sp. 403]